jgi:heme exporter protein B
VRAALAALFVREIKIAGRIGGGTMIGLVFFLILVTIVPFGIGPDRQLLARIGPSILWIAALLASLLGLDRLFQADDEDGSLDLLMMSEVPLELLVAVKCIAHWVITGLPLVAASPLFGALLAIEPPGLAGIGLSLLIGTPALTFLGAIGAALLVSLRRGGLLMAVLILPFTIPVLIFGVATASILAGPQSALQPIAVLLALSLMASVTGTFAAAAALRVLLR